MARRFFVRISHDYIREHGDDLDDWVLDNADEYRPLRTNPLYNAEVVFHRHRPRGIERQIPGLEAYQEVRATDPTASSPPYLGGVSRYGWREPADDRYTDDEDEPLDGADDNRYVAVAPVWHPLEPGHVSEDIEDSLGESQSEYEWNSSDIEFLIPHPDDSNLPGLRDGGQEEWMFEMDEDQE